MDGEERLKQAQTTIETLNQLYAVNVCMVERITNEMFSCSGENGHFFARITDYKTYEEQVEEVSWTTYLYEHGVHVAPAVRSVEGKLVETIFLMKKYMQIVLYEAAPGIHLPREQWTERVFKEIGQQIGKMHRLAKVYEKKHQIVHVNDWHENEEYDFLSYIPKNETVIRDRSKAVVAELKDLPKDEETYGLIHGDVWLENVLVTDDLHVTLIDFQDYEKHFYLFDLVVPLYSALEYSFIGGRNMNDYGRALSHSLFTGYFLENKIPKVMLKKLPLLFQLKEVF
jgi:Ser/Thr protein kinase RdoA (MazF antagonist)